MSTGICAADRLWLRAAVDERVLAGATREAALATLRAEAVALGGVVGAARQCAVQATLEGTS